MNSRISSRFRRKDKIPFCMCDCGERTKWNVNMKRYNNYLHGHNRRGVDRIDMKGDLNPAKRPEVRKKISMTLLSLGDEHPAKKFGVGEKISKAKTGQARLDIVGKGNFMFGKFGKAHPKYGYKHTKEFCKMHSERMLNGGAAYSLSFIKNPSKPQVELFDLVKLLYSSAILNYSSLNRSIDIAIPDKNIAIEYDGSYWHQNRKESDKIRQKELENVGWKFLRYCDYIPSIDELQRDLQFIC